MRSVFRAPAVGALLLLAACAPQAPIASEPQITQQSTQPEARPTESATAVYTLAPGASEARFVVNETLAGRTLPNDAVGVTKAVTGAVAFDAGGQPVPDGSKVTVDVRNIQTDRNLRDGFVRRDLLQVAQYPNVTFVATQAKGLDLPLPTGGEVTFELTGDLTVKNVTKPVIWQVTAKASGKEVTGKAFTVFQFPYFSLQKPSVLAVLSVADDIRLELDFKVTQDG